MEVTNILKINDVKWWINFFSQKHQEFSNSPDSRGRVNKSKLQELTDDLFASKLREANTMTELTEMKQKVVDLETKVTIDPCCNRVASCNVKLFCVVLLYVTSWYFRLLRHHHHQFNIHCLPRLTPWGRQPFKNCLKLSFVLSRDRSRLGHKPDYRLGWSSEYVRKSMYACCSVSVACRPAEKRRRRSEIGSIRR